MALATEMYCDGCNTVIHVSGIRTKGSMIRGARKQGWSVGKWDLCPYCRKNKKKLKEQAENLETAIDVFGGSYGQVICETVDEIAEQLKKGE